MAGHYIYEPFVGHAERLQHAGDAVAERRQLDEVMAVVRREDVERAMNLDQIDAGPV